MNLLEKQMQSIPLKRAARPEEIAKLSTSGDFNHATGADYVMDGALMRSVGQGA